MTGRVRAAGRLAPPAASQRGSASLIGLALCGFLVIATLVTADVGALAFARARAQTAADLAALAAVTPYPDRMLAPHRPAVPEGPPASGRASADLLAAGGLGSPAERASAVAASNGAEVITCFCGPLDTIVSVRVRARLIPFGTTVDVTAYARAVLPPVRGPVGKPSTGGIAVATWSSPSPYEMAARNRFANGGGPGAA